MQQIKIFKGVESEVSSLEADVNNWLADSEVRVLSITGNISPQSPSTSQSGGLSGSSYVPSDVLLVVLYESG